jgi:hypothetical protein
MAADLDDHVYALQAADVIAWTHHRKLESPAFGSDFEPLRRLIDWKTEFEGKTKLHIPMDIPIEGVEVFAKGVHAFIETVGGLPTWENMLAAHAKAQVGDVLNEAKSGI